MRRLLLSQAWRYANCRALRLSLLDDEIRREELTGQTVSSVNGVG